MPSYVPVGYVPVPREEFDGDPLWEEPRSFSRWEAWQDLRRMAAWRRVEWMTTGGIEVLERGEFIASRTYLAKRWSWGVQEVRTFLKILTQRLTRLATVRETRTGTVYRVVNYEMYAEAASDSNPASNPVTNPASNPEVTRSQPAANPLPTGKRRRVRNKQEPLAADAAEANRVLNAQVEQLRAVWREHMGGELSFGRARKAMKSLIEAHGIDAVLAHWREYFRQAVDQGKLAFCGPEAFAGKFGLYAPEGGEGLSGGDGVECEMTDEFGVMRIHHRDPATGEWIPGKATETTLSIEVGS